MKVITYVHKGKVRTVTYDELMKLKVELTAAHEDVCENCGKCCFHKKVVKGLIVLDYNNPCQFLKYVGRRSRCEVYTDRFTKCSDCLPIPQALNQKGLPNSCPYVRGIDKYKGPVDDGEWYKRMRNKMAKVDATYAGTPTSSSVGGVPDMKANTLSREDLGKPRDWRQRREQLRRKIEHQKMSRGKAGISDPRQKATYNIKPSGHALGG